MRDKKHIALAAAALALLLAVPAGCGQEEPAAEPEPAFEDIYTGSVSLVEEEIDIADEAVALSGLPALDVALTPTPSGVLAKANQKATIDYSNTTDGYVMVNFTATTATRVKVLVMGPNTNTAETRYTYDLPVQQWVTFPLSDGNGSYTVKVMEQNASTGKYAAVVDATFNVSLSNEFAPFIRPNQYVNYSDSVSPNTIAKAKELAGGESDPLKKVENIYNFVVSNLTYDDNKAATVQSGYLPVLDTVLSTKKGICFDYAALMAGMLRSQGVPCKLITGYVDNGGYHAWISVWTEENGWVDNAIYFDGTTWHRMDPTFASNGNSSEKIMQYIGNGSNYTAKNSY
ncbi:MAG: transglutaminase domain-containing protein [Oscillospiraceae bacterium]|jgi:hypothetical protein|nr:transglutaminase domain-containing protein [Oscillospiraceae bacterium]